MSHPSCIKIPGSKEHSVNTNSCSRDTDTRDQILNKRDLILLADEAFGINKWSHTVTSQTLDFVEYITGKYHVGCAAFVKVQLADGTFHEDLGYSNSEGSNKGLVIFSARNGSITNALKNALLCFSGDIATKIKNFIKIKTESISLTISTIGEPQKIVAPKTRMVPNAQSTPQKSPSRTSPTLAVVVEDDNQEISSINKELKPHLPKCPKPIANGVEIDKAVLTEDEKRLERKRRQAQKQEEYRKLLKTKEFAEKPNPRY